MALTAGYFPSNYFPHDYWQISNQFWLEYGTAAPPSVEEHMRGPPTPEPPIPSQFIRLIRDYLLSKSLS